MPSTTIVVTRPVPEQALELLRPQHVNVRLARRLIAQSAQAALPGLRGALHQRGQVTGLLRRRDALAQAARKAVYLLLGAVPWLVVAGSIEGFISPNEDVPIPVKWTVGIVSGILLYSYLLFAGKDRERS